MKIKDNTIVNETVYGTIKVGEVFKFKDNYYMKTINIVDLNDLDSGINVNAVKLKDGDLLYFGTQDICEKVDATLTIDKI